MGIALQYQQVTLTRFFYFYILYFHFLLGIISYITSIIITLKLYLIILLSLDHF
jgi:hypothetical protein